jgi:hypothetical protein
VTERKTKQTKASATTALARFTVRDDFISPDELAELQDFFQANVKWTFGWQSNTTDFEAHKYR